MGSNGAPTGPVPVPGPGEILLAYRFGFEAARIVVGMLFAVAKAALKGDAHRLITFILLIRVITR